MKKFIYSLIEFLYPRGVLVKISDVDLRIPFRFRNYYEKNYEADHIEFFRKNINKGDIILDIGAQMGLMSKLFSGLAGSQGKVYAFEPSPFTFKILQKVIRFNDFRNYIEAVPMAVSAKRGKTIFYISGMDLDPANSLVSYERKHNFKGIEVDVTSVDHFADERKLSRIDFIKIDAEGAELEVLKGAENTLKKNKPLVHLALHPDALLNFGASLEKIYAFVKSCGYKVFYKSKEMHEREFISQSGLFDVELLPEKQGAED